jgi:DNA processing protein
VEETASLVALLKCGHRPWKVYADLVEKAGEARPLLEEEQGLLADQLVDLALRDIDAWSHEGLRLLTVLDDGYPKNLRAVHDRPPLLFVAGALRPAHARSVAVVGARNASADGIAKAREIATHLAEAGVTVASGLAKGIDTAAHMAALEHGGRTFAVIGTGLRHCYPPENAELQRRIAQEGAVISQFWPDTPPSRDSFPKRNGVMSGMSLATVIVEASQTSGARTQARLALAHGRPVVLLQDLLTQEWAHELAERPGTYVVDSPAGVTALVDRLTAPGLLTA